ncbi:glutactin [Scaptodrosophila lebanonensis]|uniref:Glutactin n=1 Tax=Drosophila lebanonensis TaxID=7225 RepID=A0A6J2TWL0_DROLE|nr:glutactin [Scaptodrosophila lebanonensis]
MLMLHSGSQLLRLQLLFVALFGCHALQNGWDDNESSEDWSPHWTPPPLRPAPWALGITTTPAPQLPQIPQWPEAGQVPPAPQPPPQWEPEPQWPEQSPAVQLPEVGEVHGLRGYKTIKNRPIDAFLGLRYGQVSSGLGRFQKATPLQYQGRIDATRQSSNCAQFPELESLQQAEARGEAVDDCLTLNIFAPAGARDLPVLVFVHGEMLFDGGAEEAQPDYFLEHDVLLVAINYRLAPFGFLAALSEELPGNVALSDIHLALEWLQSNVRHFGGDAEQITLFGQAGGATLAHALSISGKANGLFSKLILQSGTALNPYFIDDQPLNTLATFARLARCPSSVANLEPLYDCLGRLSTSQLVRAFQELWQQNESRGRSFVGGFKLVVNDVLGYLPDHPAHLAATNSVPTLLGAAKDAGAFILSRFYPEIERLQSRNLSDYINVALRHTAPPQHHQIWLNWALREIFTPEDARYPNGPKVATGLLELTNLILYREPVIDAIRFTHRKHPTYLYAFDYRGEHHRFGHLRNPLPFGLDATLSDDSIYLFPYPEEVSQLNPEDKTVARALVTMWVNFAQTGVPNPNPGVWPSVSSEYGPFLRFTNSKENTLELDQHFGEGINVPNLYNFNISTTNATTTTARTPYAAQWPREPARQPAWEPPTTTTTATPVRPQYSYPNYPQWPREPARVPVWEQPEDTVDETTTTSTAHTPYNYPNYQQQPPRQSSWEQPSNSVEEHEREPPREPSRPAPSDAGRKRPSDYPSYEEYVKAQELLRQQLIQQHEQLRREQLERAKKLREEQEIERQRQEQEEQEQEEREERERQQQLQEQQARDQQEREREDQAREELAREQQREQQREHQREPQEQETDPYNRGEQPGEQENNEGDPYDDYLRNHDAQPEQPHEYAEHENPYAGYDDYARAHEVQPEEPHEHPEQYYPYPPHDQSEDEPPYGEDDRTDQDHNNASWDPSDYDINDRDQYEQQNPDPYEEDDEADFVDKTRVSQL